MEYKNDFQMYVFFDIFLTNIFIDFAWSIERATLLEIFHMIKRYRNNYFIKI